MRHTRKVCVVLLLLNKTCCSANVNKVNIIILWIFKLTFYNVSFYEEQIKDIFHLIQAIKQTQNQQKLSISKLFILRHNTCRTGIFSVSLILSIFKIINVFIFCTFIKRAVNRHVHTMYINSIFQKYWRRINCKDIPFVKSLFMWIDYYQRWS